ncbi:hypothetical protein P029_02670 [Anaplasma phagocytophilum str. Norway variant2]|uniref:Uncharacterized protein n=1 Tax=Anaplasma phagocytophilum str. Norway variant2 TaxID=1392507 RepID=A0A168HB50_ANAPH|nr:hypothetical protein P029_02670 [Anaplasma phagocytophilum str. Norway variant2]
MTYLPLHSIHGKMLGARALLRKIYNTTTCYRILLSFLGNNTSWYGSAHVNVWGSFKVFKAIYGSYKNIMRSYFCEGDIEQLLRDSAFSAPLILRVSF